MDNLMNEQDWRAGWHSRSQARALAKRAEVEMHRKDLTRLKEFQIAGMLTCGGMPILHEITQKENIIRKLINKKLATLKCKCAECMGEPWDKPEPFGW